MVCACGSKFRRAAQYRRHQEKCAQATEASIKTGQDGSASGGVSAYSTPHNTPVHPTTAPHASLQASLTDYQIQLFKTDVSHVNLNLGAQQTFHIPTMQQQIAQLQQLQQLQQQLGPVIATPEQQAQQAQQALHVQNVINATIAASIAATRHLDEGGIGGGIGVGGTGNGVGEGIGIGLSGGGGPIRRGRVVDGASPYGAKAKKVGRGVGGVEG